MSRLFLLCVMVFLTAVYAFLNDDYSTGARFTAAAIAFVLACAGFGALCGEVFEQGWNAVSRARDLPKPPEDRL